MENSNNDKELKLNNFNIIILNYIDDTKKQQLLDELTELYNEYKPFETEYRFALPLNESPPGVSPDDLFGKKIIYYD